MRAAIAALGAATMVAATAVGPAAAARPTWQTVPVRIASGAFEGHGDAPAMAWRTELTADRAAWMRIVFADTDLGHNSYVILRAPNGEQRLDANSMKEWFNGSAYFAGGRVALELYVAPGDKGVSVRVERILAGDPGPGIETACGGDDRVGSGDNRVGRLFAVGCTAWGIANGAWLTAGHCTDLDPDNAGPLLPDGVLDLTGVLEFNVPASQSDGTLNPAPVNDQYPVDVSSVQWRFDGVNQGLGKDWAIFRVNPNSNTKLLPWQAYGVPFRVTREEPVADETVRVTGFGTDTGVTNQTNQTSTGLYKGETASGGTIRMDHTVDTEGGNSGSPIIWEQMNLGIGIHTNGGCQSNGTGTNSGTSFDFDGLENAVNDFPGTNTIYADQLHPLRVAEEGTLFRPFASLAPAIAATPTGGVVSMYVGFYALTSGTVLTRAMTLQAPAGGVVILGN